MKNKSGSKHVRKYMEEYAKQYLCKSVDKLGSSTVHGLENNGFKKNVFEGWTLIFLKHDFSINLL